VTNEKNAPVMEAERLFLRGYACSQAILLAFADDVGLDRLTAKKIASTFGGGMGRLRKTCGALTGAFMVTGMKYGNIQPDDMEKKLYAYEKVRNIARKFEELHGTTECGQLLSRYCNDAEAIDKRRHHRIICHKLVRDAAAILLETVF
jgi:C_GCAxxG_C_C family probable redox protein